MQATRLLAAAIWLTALAATLWLAFGLLDATLAFEPPARVKLTTAGLLTTGLAGLTAAILALRVSLTKAAARADTCLASPRAPASAAWSLAHQSGTPLAQWLAEQSLRSASGHLQALKWHAFIPWRIITWGTAALALPLLITGALALTNPGAVATVMARLRNPHQDIPPFSPLVFTITPASPSAVYGSPVTLTANITGGELPQPVDCLVRQSATGNILRLPAFRETESRFTRQIDRITEPLEIAFAVGRARSPWHPVEILLEPNILNGKVLITPPAYTQLQPTSFPLDTNEISAVEGSTVVLELTSNRPLSSGTLTLTHADNPAATTAPDTFPATVSPSHTAAFSWTATRSGRLAATLRDLRGTPSARPLELNFRTLPDQPPSVVLSSPPSLMLATPKSVIPVNGRAEDDFALAKIHFVRTLAGFRDRAHLVAPALRDPQFTFSSELNLDELGLEPGQTIELMLDASDHNPSLLGQGSSEIARIRIISEEQYATLIRAKTTLAEFHQRFDAAKNAIDQARKALENLDAAANADNPDATQKAADATQKAHAEAAKLLARIASDFPAFEMEKHLQDLARERTEPLNENLEQLKQFNPNAPKEEQLEDIREMRDRLGQHQEREQALEHDLNQVRHAALLLEMAAKFRQIYESQANLSKRFRTITEELRQGIDQNRRLLPSLADTQQKNRDALDAFKTELQKRLDALPEDPALAPLADSASAFLDELTQAAPETLMDAASRDGKNGDATSAFANAERARALLERLLATQEPFPNAARGNPPNLDVPNPDINQNLAQLLQGLLDQNQPPNAGDGNNPGNPGPGQGQAGANGPTSGYSMNLPVVGPDRLRFDSPSPQAGQAGGKANPDASPPLPENTETGVIPPTQPRNTQSDAATPDAIPEPYRDAVKRFLTPDDEPSR